MADKLFHYYNKDLDWGEALVVSKVESISTVRTNDEKSWYFVVTTRRSYIIKYDTKENAEEGRQNLMDMIEGIR